MMTTLNNRVSALFADPLHQVLGGFGDPNRVAVEKLAPMSLWEDDSSIYVELDVPGMTIEDLDVTLEKGTLRISGKRQKFECQRGAAYEERNFGQFERRLAMGDSVDPNSIDASLQHGVLRIKFSKRPDQQRQKIAIVGDSSLKNIESS